MGAEPVAIAANIHDVAVMHEAIDERGRHHLVAEDTAPFIEGFIAREDRARAFVAPAHELKEQHRARPTDRQIADFVDDHERRKAERAEAAGELATDLRLFERRDEIGERRVVDAPSALRRGDGETDGEMRFADAGRAEKDDILPALNEGERVQALETGLSGSFDSTDTLLVALIACLRHHLRADLNRPGS